MSEQSMSRFRAANRAFRLSQLKAVGIPDKHLLTWRFDTAEDSKVIRMARNYVEHWQQAEAQNLGLLFWGSVGTGKTFAAACIANALLDQGVAVRMTNFSRILSQLVGMKAADKVALFKTIATVPLLIIDDLGIERNTEYALEQVYAVVDERYKSGRPLIVTRNLTISEIRTAEDIARARIYSRILEMCTPVNVSGADRRAALGQAKQNETKKILLGGDVIGQRNKRAGAQPA